MGGRETAGNLFTQGLARLVANAGTEIMDAILDVSTRAGSHCKKKEEEPRLRPAQWWNSPEPGTKPGRR